MFWFFGFIFLALYNGAGEYHGFFWVVPSFFSVAATLLLVAILFDESILTGLSKRRYTLLMILVTIWVVWSHPLGKFSLIAITLSYLLYLLFKKVLHLSPLFKESLKRVVPLFASGILVFFLLEVLPYLFGITPSRYYSLQGTLGQAFVESSISIFQRLYINYFQLFSYHLFFLIMGLFVAFFTRKLSLLSLWFSFFITAGTASIFGDLGYRMLVFLWPITFILYSYGLYFITKKVINEFRKSFVYLFKEKVQQTRKSSWIKRIQYKKKILLLTILFVLIIAIYIYPFVQENYSRSVKYADFQNQRMSDWNIDTSIIDYLNEETRPGDLVIFSDSNAFLAVTSLGLTEREVAYSDWNWNASYSFLLDKVNGSYLLSTGIPQKSRVQNLTSAFDNRLTLHFVASFGFLNIYEIAISQTITDLFAYDGIDSIPLVSDYQESFWSKTANVNLYDSNIAKIEGNVSLMISLSQINTGQNDFIWHEYSSTQDWSSENGICFYWYGNGSHNRVEILLFAPNVSNKYIYVFNDDFVGWNRVLVPLSSFTSVSGHPSLAEVGAIYFRFSLDSPYNQTFYLDQPAVCVLSSLSENDFSLLKTSFQTNLEIGLLFFIIPFLPGLVWGWYVFSIRDKYALFALSVGLSFSILTLSTFIMNVFCNVTINRISLVLSFAFAIVAPLLFHLLKLKKNISSERLDL